MVDRPPSRYRRIPCLTSGLAPGPTFWTSTEKRTQSPAFGVPSHVMAFTTRSGNGAGGIVVVVLVVVVDEVVVVVVPPPAGLAPVLGSPISTPGSEWRQPWSAGKPARSGHQSARPVTPSWS